MFPPLKTLVSAFLGPKPEIGPPYGPANRLSIQKSLTKTFGAKMDWFLQINRYEEDKQNTNSGHGGMDGSFVHGLFQQPVGTLPMRPRLSGHPVLCCQPVCIRVPRPLLRPELPLWFGLHRWPVCRDRMRRSGMSRGFLLRRWRLLSVGLRYQALPRYRRDMFRRGMHAVDLHRSGMPGRGALRGWSLLSD